MARARGPTPSPPTLPLGGFPLGPLGQGSQLLVGAGSGAERVDGDRRRR
jgi:hypothetical protein